MNITRFETGPTDACNVSTNVPASGYMPNRTYEVTVSTSVPGGVGHVLIPSKGEFVEADAFDTAVYTESTHKFVSKTWTWKSPRNAARAQLFGVCASGYQAKAYLASMVQVIEDGAPTLESCSISNSTALGKPCWCADSDTTWCEAGLCCWPDFSCRTCTTQPEPIEPAEKKQTPVILDVVAVVFVVAAALLMGSIFGCRLCFRGARNAMVGAERAAATQDTGVSLVS